MGIKRRKKPRPRYYLRLAPSILDKVTPANIIWKEFIEPLHVWREEDQSISEFYREVVFHVDERHILHLSAYLNTRIEGYKMVNGHRTDEVASRLVRKRQRILVRIDDTQKHFVEVEVWTGEVIRLPIEKWRNIRDRFRVVECRHKSKFLA